MALDDVVSASTLEASAWAEVVLDKIISASELVALA